MAKIQNLEELEVGQLYITGCSIESCYGSLERVLSEHRASSAGSSKLSLQGGGQPRLVIVLDVSVDGTVVLTPLTTRQGRNIDDDSNFRETDDRELLRRILHPCSPMEAPTAFQIDVPPGSRYQPPVNYLHLVKFRCNFQPGSFRPIVDKWGNTSHLSEAELGRFHQKAATVTKWLIQRSRANLPTTSSADTGSDDTGECGGGGSGSSLRKPSFADIVSGLGAAAGGCQGNKRKTEHSSTTRKNDNQVVEAVDATDEDTSSVQFDDEGRFLPPLEVDNQEFELVVQETFRPPSPPRPAYDVMSWLQAVPTH